MLGEHEGSGSLLLAVQKSEHRIHPLRAWLEGVKNGGEKDASLPCPRAGRGIACLILVRDPIPWRDVHLSELGGESVP